MFEGRRLLIATKHSKERVIAPLLEKELGDLTKGFEGWKDLRACFSRIISSGVPVVVFTDMRASYNPARIRVIRMATKKLISKAQSVCTNCKTPGFDVHHVMAGLPCSQCLKPTRSPLSEIYQCKHCDYKIELKYPTGVICESPAFCDFCNP